MTFIHESMVTEPITRVNEPSFCLILQGGKEMLFGDERLVYEGGHYLVASVDLPVTGQVTKASADVPYVALKLELTIDDLIDAVGHVELTEPREPKRGMYIADADEALFDVALRLARLVDTPDHVALAPLYKRELLYWVSQGSNGEMLRQLAFEGSQAFRIKRVIDHIIANFNETIRSEELARVANMSVSTLHRHFKEVTAMSPLQFQKQLRLQEARRLLLMQATDVGEAAFQVGYESPSQFSREYARLFGLSPRADVRQQRQL
ncbi:AraC family transcriptional regulator [Exiguobacterium aurantiacum]